MPTKNPRVFTIPASAPFLPVLIGALLKGELTPGIPAGGDPLALAQATLYLPTRRACRLAREVFLEARGGDAAILPRIAAIGDIDEDEIAFADAATGALAQAALDLPPTIAALERRLLLAELIAKWASSRALQGIQGTPLVANTPASALALADDLARLIDDMTTRQVSWDRLDGLVPDQLDKFWQLSLGFLKIARERWPQLLNERGVIEPAERRDRLISAESSRLAKSTAPVIAAGSTGSMPATATLLAAIAHLPHGAVVLPGLDMDLDDASWRRIAGGASDDEAPAVGHPQFAMQALLTRIGITRSAVTPLAPAQGREAFMSEAMRPAATSELWHKHLNNNSFSTRIDSAMSSLSVVEAANAEEEALAVAVVLREAYETPGKSAALVTPDRALARRVLAALERWNVPVDDSGGDALADTPAGLFARLAVAAALGGLEPATLLALLKHPLLRLGAGPHAHHRAVAALERAVLRGPRPKPGSAGLAHALATYAMTRGDLHPRDPRGFVTDPDLDAARKLIAALATTLVPLETLKSSRHVLATLAGLHRNIVSSLSTDDAGTVAAFEGMDGAKLDAAFDDLINTPAASVVTVALGDYTEMFETIAATGTVRMREQPNVRIRILGLLEARLQTIDRVVLGGLNEGSWPPETRGDPWLSRPMRKQLGLNLPELRTGLTAHDFAQALGAQDVILTRAAKVAGAPAVASRFVQRLAALAGQRWPDALARGDKYLTWARALDYPAGPPKPAECPEPKPPRAARPIKLSVTEIEDWLRDPYTIYARHVLRLFPLDAVDTPPGAADRGSVIHGAIGDFTKQFAGELPVDPERELIAIGKKRFAPLADYPEATAFWWPRFLRIARWLTAWERGRRPHLAAVYGEISGKLAIPLGERSFTLSARADRIERRTDGSYVIIDYKTGSPRSEKQVRTGLAPQLTLEAAILRGGGFETEGVARGSVAELAYVTLKGGDPAGLAKPIEFKDGTPDSQADNALKRLTVIAAHFENETTAYSSLVHPMWTTYYGNYDHLARVKEWSATGGESAGEE